MATLSYVLTRTYPSNPLDDRTVLEEPTSSFLICWEENEHDGEGCPAQGEGAHDDRHHGRDPEHGEGNLIRMNCVFIIYLLCAACSLCSFFSTLVNFLLKVKDPSVNQVLLFSLITAISSSSNSWILTLLFSSKLDV